MHPADSALGMFRNLDQDLCVTGGRFCVLENPEFIAGNSECLSFPHCQYTASLDLDTFLEIFHSAIVGNFDCEKCLLKVIITSLRFILES